MPLQRHRPRAGAIGPGARSSRAPRLFLDPPSSAGSFAPAIAGSRAPSTVPSTHRLGCAAQGHGLAHHRDPLVRLRGARTSPDAQPARRDAAPRSRVAGNGGRERLDPARSRGPLVRRLALPRAPGRLPAGDRADHRAGDRLRCLRCGSLPGPARGSRGRGLGAPEHHRGRRHVDEDAATVPAAGAHRWATAPQVMVASGKIDRSQMADGDPVREDDPLRYSLDIQALRRAARYSAHPTSAARASPGPGPGSISGPSAGIRASIPATTT